ncbi:hypothetical protein EBB07_19985 [Paenibacillaceae bacterium]|nr:hypothetical protein EBB07_19985 [Paenibacillaceae bacterium]
MLKKLRVVILLLTMIIAAQPLTAASIAAQEPFAIGHRTDQERQERFARLTELTNELYRSSTAGNRQAGFQYIQRLQHAVDEQSFRALGSAEGWAAADEALASIAKAVRQGKSASAWRSSAAQLLLAFDALIYEEQGIWLTYHKVLLSDINRTMNAWRRQTDDNVIAAVATLKQLSDHIELVTPAALMQRDPSRVEALRQTYRQAAALLHNAQGGQYDRLYLDHALSAVIEAINRLFELPGQTADEPVMAPPIYREAPWRWVLMLGTFILTVLSYASWRKFNFEQNRLIQVGSSPEGRRR